MNEVEPRLELYTVDVSCISAVQGIVVLRGAASRPEHYKLDSLFPPSEYSFAVRNDSKAVIARLTGRIACQKYGRKFPTMEFNFDEPVPDGLEPHEKKTLELNGDRPNIPYGSSSGVLVVTVTRAVTVDGKFLPLARQTPIGF